MDKVLQEFRIVETEDGFQIEIKGDKERLRDWVLDMSPRGWGSRPPRRQGKLKREHGESLENRHSRRRHRRHHQ